MVTTKLEKISLILGAVLICLISLLPFYEMVRASLLPGQLHFMYPPKLIPTVITLESFLTLVNLQKSMFLIWLRNSLLVALSSAIVSTLVGSFGGYVIVRFPIRGKRYIMYSILTAYLMTGILVSIPIFLIIVFLGLYDTLQSLALVYTFVNIPLCLYFSSNFYRGLPIEIEEAAIVDGAGLNQLITRVVIPISLPALISIFYFSFVLSFNEYLFASILLSSQEKYTVVRSFYILYTYQEEFSWGIVNAAALLICVPLIIVFLILERYIISGLTAGALKA
jgi:multiple sugar transport system permease protein